MKMTFVEPSQNNQMLTKWRGSTATIWIFEVLKRLVLRLTRPGETEVLCVLGASCRHIKAPFRWNNASISIMHSENPDVLDMILDNSQSAALSFETIVGVVRVIQIPVQTGGEPQSQRGIAATKLNPPTSTEAIRDLFAKLDASQ